MQRSRGAAARLLCHARGGTVSTPPSLLHPLLNLYSPPPLLPTCPLHCNCLSVSFTQPHSHSRRHPIPCCCPSPSSPAPPPHNHNIHLLPIPTYSLCFFPLSSLFLSSSLLFFFFFCSLSFLPHCTCHLFLASLTFFLHLPAFFSPFML